MSISSDQNRANYSGNGSSATFNYPYEFHNDSDLAVLVYNSSRSTVTVAQALTTNYTLSGSKDLQGRYLNGANVVFNSTPATGDEIVIFGSTTVNSVYALGFNEHISRPDLVKALDHLVLINQRLNNQITRSLRLPDSFPYTFDTTLPERMKPSAPVVVNSSGTRLEYGFVVGSSSFAGIFPTNQGGTGASLLPAVGQMLYADTTSSFGLMGPPGRDQVIVGSGVTNTLPAFGAVNLASNSSVINVLPVANGGTSHSSFVSAALVYATSASILSFIANGGADQPLVGNIGGAPSYQPLNIASNSSVTGILATSRGGTGNSGFVQYGVLYMETNTKMAHIPSAANGRILTAHGSSAPTFDVLSISPIAALRKTADYVMTTSDETIICDGSGATFVIRPPDVTAADGKFFNIKKVDSSFNVITISGSATIDGTSLVLTEQFDSVKIQAIAGEYHVIERFYQGRTTGWKNYTPTTGLTGSSLILTGKWMRSGEEMIGRIAMHCSTVFTGGLPTFTIPFTIDVNKFPINPIVFVNSGVQIIGKADLVDASGTTHRGKVLYHGTTTVLVNQDQTFNGNLYVTNQVAVAPTVPFTWAVQDRIIMDFQVPIVNWTGEQS